MSASNHTPIPDGFKLCTKCGEIKPETLEYFGPKKNGRNGFRADCKNCGAQYSRERYKENPEKYRQSSLDSYYRNHERGKKKGRDYYHNHKETLIKRNREWKANHQEEIRQQSKIKKQTPEGRRADQAKGHHRRARARHLPRKYTANQWIRALDYFSRKNIHCCAVCGRPPGLWHTLSADHWIPISSPDCPGTVPTNIVPLCHGIDGCNNSKNSRDPVEWLTDKFGSRRAKRILARIEAYFAWVKEQDD